MAMLIENLPMQLVKRRELKQLVFIPQNIGAFTLAIFKKSLQKVIK